MITLSNMTNILNYFFRYGVPIDGAAVKMIYKIRSQRLNTRVKIADRCLILALIGILFMGMDTEICAQNMLGVTKVSLFLSTGQSLTNDGLVGSLEVLELGDGKHLKFA